MKFGRNWNGAMFLYKIERKKERNEKRSERRGEGIAGRDEEKKSLEKSGEKEREVSAKKASKRTVCVFFFQCNDKSLAFIVCVIYNK